MFKKMCHVVMIEKCFEKSLGQKSESPSTHYRHVTIFQSVPTLINATLDFVIMMSFVDGFLSN